MKTINTAVVGFGYWGEKILQHLLKISDINYIAIVDNDRNKAKKAKKYHLDFFQNLNQLPSKVNCCVICTPENTHYQIGKSCLKGNLHTLMEKPFTTNYHEAKELVQLAKQKKLTLMVNHTFMYDKSFLIIQRRLAEIGNLKRIYSLRSSPTTKKYTNIVADFLPHDISIFCSLTAKKPKNVYVISDKLLSRSFDSAYVQLDFGEFKTYSYLSYLEPTSRREMFLLGSKGIISWQKRSPVKDEILIYKYNKQGKLKLREGLNIKDKDQTLNTVLTEFIRGIRTKKETKTSAAKTLEEVKILEKVLSKV